MENQELLNKIRKQLDLPEKMDPVEIVKENFFNWYFHSGMIDNLQYMGIKILKCPFDMWNYQDIIYTLNPDVVIETGTFMGASALFLADVMERIKHGKVITIDIIKRSFPQHPRITYLTGSSVDEDIITKVKGLIQPTDKVMVIMDSDHRFEHVTKELEIYGPMTSMGQYCIVEDTFIFNGNTGEFPRLAVNKFLEKNSDFVIDTSMHRFGITLNPCGYLYKKPNNFRIITQDFENRGKNIKSCE